MYNLTTCFEFHQLLIAIFLAYRKALCALKNAIEKKKYMKNLVQKSNCVLVCGNLLSKIVSSRMLCQHFVACLSFLHISIYTQCLAYNKFTKSAMGYSNSCTEADNPDSVVEDINLENNECLNEMFLKWVHLQVGYWLDLSVLSRTFSFSDPAHPVPNFFCRCATSKA